ncbi:MAG: hypothetical protein ABSA39_18865 [Edaphobacter sp.]
MMKERVLNGQKFRFDREETINMYRMLKAGGADECDCGYCAYFAKHRRQAYNDELFALMSELGIDYTKEDEVWTVSNGDENETMQFYSWFYLAGELEEADRLPSPSQQRGFPSLTVVAECPPRLKLDLACTPLPPMPVGFLENYPSK